ncbi:MAG: hypothetical protein JWQ27_134 [Ferruginibacter sp.]|nr:hypothetical protein [Ferruginibacter sp.]
MGGQKAIALFYQFLSAHVDLTIIGTSDNQLPDDFPARFYPSLGKSILRYINPLLFLKLAAILRRERVSAIVLEHPYFAWLGYLLKKTTGVQLYIRSHNIEAIRFKSTGRWWWKLLWHYERFIHRQADLSFFITAEDQQYAIENFGIAPAKTICITYGFEEKTGPTENEKLAAKQFLRDKYQIPRGAKILFFNGTLSYLPNQEALQVITKKLNPVWLTSADFDYRVLICGKGLPADFNELKTYSDKRILYAGFVNDIRPYFLGADIFINPVIEGGGIKTKLVEALGFDLSCVSTESGATGIPLTVTAHKLTVVPDGDWGAFAQAVKVIGTNEKTAAAFFNHFYWGNIAASAAAAINYSLTKKI